MKKIIGFVLASIFTFCTCVQVQGQEVIINPLNVARAFALKTPTHFHCSLQGLAFVSNSWQNINMEFVMRKSDFGITNLTINGVAIDLPEPIYGLPIGAGGFIKDVWLNVTAKTSHGEYAGNGYLQKPIVLKSDHLDVEIRPADIKQEIPIDVGIYGNDIRMDIEGVTFGYGYGVSDGKFYVYLPPVGGRYHYILRRWSDGSIIGDGWVEPFKDTVTANNTYLGIHYIGNVLGIEFPNQIGMEDWIGVNNVDLNCEIPMTTGSNVLGKVIFTDVGAGNLEIMIWGDFRIHVQGAIGQNGEMPNIPLVDNSIAYPWGVYTKVHTTSGNIGRVVISIIPKPSNSIQNPWVNLHRFYGPLSMDNGKG